MHRQRQKAKRVQRIEQDHDAVNRQLFIAKLYKLDDRCQERNRLTKSHATTYLVHKKQKRVYVTPVFKVESDKLESYYEWVH